MDQPTEELALRELAAGDLARAKEHGVDRNPFSTHRARLLWQQGWDGVRPALLTDQSTDWRYWERGRQARLLSDSGDGNVTKPPES